MVCSRCGTGYNLRDLVWRCRCGGYLSCPSVTDFGKEKIGKDEGSFWRYSHAIAGSPSEIAAYFGEGMTPLIESRIMPRVRYKLDFLFPSGSFKDRGTAVLVNALKAAGITQVIEDSSGNAGSSIAMYCARAGIDVKIYVPQETPQAKKAQIRAYGGTVVEIEGDREETARRSRQDASRSFYASHNWQPLFIEGVKTFALEIWEQMNFTVPRCIVMPVGYGSLVLGAYKAYFELLSSGQISSIPRLFGVQPQNIAPLFGAFQRQEREVLKPVSVQGPTKAGALACRMPVRSREILRAFRETKGAVEIVSEEEIDESVKELGSEGIFVEPSSAVAVAGLKKLRYSGQIREDEDVVVPLTGTGLKALEHQ